MTTRWIGSGFVIAACGLMLAGAACGADQVSPAAQEEAQNIFKARCTMCHGAVALAAGMALNPRPRNWTDPAWQKATPDAEIEKAIVGVGQAVGKSVLMPANPDLKDKPEVVKALLGIVRGFAAK